MEKKYMSAGNLYVAFRLMLITEATLELDK
jgi:hypothetical protein